MTKKSQNSDLTVQKKSKPNSAVSLTNRAKTRDILTKLDEVRSKRLPDVTSMLEMWEEYNADFDTNDAILRNLKMVQFRIESMHEEYWIHKTETEQRLLDLLTDDPATYDKYKVAEKAAAEEEEREGKRLDGLMKLCVQLAKEFRACAMQRSVNVHVRQVDLLQEAFVGILHVHVHDQMVLNAIQQDLRIAYLALFPIDVKEGS